MGKGGVEYQNFLNHFGLSKKRDTKNVQKCKPNVIQKLYSDSDVLQDRITL